jgi:hypothetical protein
MLNSAPVNFRSRVASTSASVGIEIKSDTVFGARAMTAHAAPLVPEDRFRPLRLTEFLMRACVASAQSAATPITRHRSAEQIARERWGETDRITRMILTTRAPTTPTNTTGAAAISPDIVGDFVSSLQPLSAAARLFEAAPRVSLARYHSVLFPRRATAIDPTKIPWVDELNNFPVQQFQLESVPLGPMCKLGAISVVSRETVESGAADTVIPQLLRENAALALDASLFSTTAASSARPAGILAGVTPLTGTANMLPDLEALAAAIAPHVSGFAYVMNPAQAIKVRLERGQFWPDDVAVWSSIGIPAGTVICLDPLAFASAFGPEPEIESSGHVMTLMDTAPPNDGSLAPSTMSMFQQDMVATKLKIRAAWVWRVNGAVAFTTGVTW